MVTSRCTEDDVLLWLMKLRDRVFEFKLDWHPNAIIVNCTKAEFNCNS